MMGSFGGKVWTIVTVLIVLTWVLWFFGVDVRDVKYIVKDELADIRANAPSNFQVQSPSVISSSPTQEKEDELIEGCKQNYELCKEVATKKYDISISLLEAEKFSQVSEAEEFYDTWKGQQAGLDVEWGLSHGFGMLTENNFPLVLLATKVRGPQGSLPLVVICDKTGQLIDSSKNQLSCG